MGAHLKLGKPLMIEVHGSPDPVKFDDLDEARFQHRQLTECDADLLSSRGCSATKASAARQLRWFLCAASLAFPISSSCKRDLGAT